MLKSLYLNDCANISLTGIGHLINLKELICFNCEQITNKKNIFAFA